MCDMTRPYVWHDSFWNTRTYRELVWLYGPRHHLWDMTHDSHSYEWNDSTIRVTCLILKHPNVSTCLTSHIWISHITKMNELWVMSHRRCVAQYYHTSLTCSTSHIWIQSGKDPLIIGSIGHFPQKSPVIRGSLTERDLQLKKSYASSPPCKPCYTYLSLHAP